MPPEFLSNQQPLLLEYSTRSLFGGAITMDVPTNWLDTSSLRPVPDNQECFQSNNSDGPPTLLSVELLEQQTHVSNENAAEFFYQDLATHVGFPSSGGSLQFFDIPSSHPLSQIDRTPLIHHGDDVVHISGGLGLHKHVRLFSLQDGQLNTPSDALHSVRIDLVVFRLFQQETDMLVTLSTPQINPDPLLPQAMDPILRRAVDTLRILDWGLFGLDGNADDRMETEAETTS